MVDDNMLGNVLDKSKEIIDIETFNSSKILIDIHHKLPYNITSKNIEVLIKCFIKDDVKFYPHVFLEEALYDK